MTWWAWMILGAVLLGAELFAVDAQFYLVFLGVSAAVVGLATLFGITMPEWGQWLTFAAVSVAFFVFVTVFVWMVFLSPSSPLSSLRSSSPPSPWRSPEIPGLFHDWQANR